MSFEDELTRALRQAVDDAPPPSVEGIAFGAHQRGTRHKRRRAVFAGAAAVVLLAGAGTLAAQLRPAATVAAPAAQPSTTAPSTAPSTEPTVTVERMLDLLRERLPGATLSTPVGLVRGGDDQHAPVRTASAAFTVTDSRGSSSVRVMVVRLEPRNPSTTTYCPPGSTPTTCTVTARPDGSRLTAYRPEAALGGEQVWVVTLLKPDGTQVIADSGNLPGPGSKADGPTRDAPVLDTPQLSALATDPVWQSVSDAIAAGRTVPGDS
ncbi:hypothetical protein GCM10010441_61590 [Kitasatospora paracochleata]|uniref:Uncharacterized protein n=1 Tax=Kitasatospora paracochleata TaxID=58354 RepID=A0ABT1J1Y1_9ACTN|nr:hypothetical protein [Kitasatospora paracochleata]MCP2311159.1 hypothetical protein [Kitasatospora paracochleata]